MMIFLGLTGCQSSDQVETVVDESAREVSLVSLPVEGYAERRTFKNFGEFIQDRFTGYHVGEDVEFVGVADDVSVHAIASGTVVRAEWVSGYGGLVVIQHTTLSRVVTALYGHLDSDSFAVEVGSRVEGGEFLANLGEGGTNETDGERKHLHFGLYEGSEDRINGYEATPAGVKRWINPTVFFDEYGVESVQSARRYESSVEVGGSVYNLSFDIPAGWGVEYVPSLESLNLFVLNGEGTARDRSQLLIRYFDASQFLTLPTVTVYSTVDMSVGVNDYVARRYDIEKKTGVAAFKDQPLWRNDRHLVTDFRKNEGRARYFVVASNPALDAAVYESVLMSMEIL